MCNVGILDPSARSLRRNVCAVNSGEGLEVAPDLASMRIAYDTETMQVPELNEKTVADTWYEQLGLWLSDAAEADVVEPNAMVLATTDSEGRPASRTVLCKSLDERGIVFYTNRTSAKAHQLREVPWASATFPMYALQRQVHVQGMVEHVSEEETNAYWATRPRGSQLGAWASVQSALAGSRQVLEDALAEATRRYADHEQVPVPPHWGGIRIVAERVEFWQGQRDRLHDRLRYRFAPTTREWLLERLQP